MNRLTKKNEDGIGHKDCLLSCSNCTAHPCENLLEMVGELYYYENLNKQGRLMILPCNVGDELYRITYPYRQPPKVTKYRVKNFRTIKKGQKLQLEVQADCVPVKNWMYFEDFYTSREEAEKALAELKGTEE